MMYKRILIALIVPFLSQVLLAADANAGKAKSTVCAACHGASGISMIPGYPHLAGQNAQYLESSMKEYKNGQRTGPNAMIMKVQMMQLSDKDIADLAAYYSQLKR